MVFLFALCYIIAVTNMIGLTKDIPNTLVSIICDILVIGLFHVD
jgi:hypothetical protein